MLGVLMAMGAGCGGSPEDGAGDPASDTRVSESDASVVSSAVDDLVDASACTDELAPLLGSLEELDSRLSVGLSFSDYSERVGDARVAYDALDFASLSPDCIKGPGVQLEKALNSYQRAYTTWNDCIGDIDCSNDSIQGELQREWARATVQIGNARKDLL